MEQYNVDINEGKVRVTIDSGLPHLIAMDDDILSTGVVIYYLRVCVMFYISLYLHLYSHPRQNVCGLATILDKIMENLNTIWAGMGFSAQKVFFSTEAQSI